MRLPKRLPWLLISVASAWLLLIVTARAATPPGAPRAAGAPHAPAPGEYLVSGGEQVGGWPYRLAVSGTHVYVGADTLLRPLDAAQPGALVQAGQVFTLPSGLTQLAVDGPRLYAATLGDVYILDNRNPGDLRMLGVFTAPASVHVLAARGPYLYVGDDNRGLLAVDVSDPAHPQLAGEAALSGTLKALAISGTLALTGSSDHRLYALSLANPLQPVVVGSVGLGATPRSVTINGGYAYVTNDGLYYNLRVVDLATLALDGRLTLAGAAYEVMASGHYAYVTAFPTTRSTLYAVDMISPTQPVLVGQLADIAEGAYAALGADTIFVAGQESGSVVSVDVRVPSAPALLGAYAGPVRARAVAIAPDGHYAAVADYWKGLSVVDLQDISGRLVQVGQASVVDVSVDVAYSGTLAYLSAGNTGLHIFDLSDPRAPAPLGTLEPSGAAGGLAITGTTVYLAAGDSGLRIVDASDPAQPVERGAFHTPEWLYDVAAGPRLDAPGQVAYLASTGWLRILDTTDPAAPMELGHAYIGGANVGVAVEGSLVYLANATFGLFVYDVSNPQAPLPAGSYPWSGLSGVAVADHNVGLVEGTGGLRVLDMTLPDQPVVVGVYDTPGIAYGIAARGGRFLVADDTGGLAQVYVFKVLGQLFMPGIRR